MTELSDRAPRAPCSGWLPEISYGYLELKLFLSTVIYDLARHTETFRKRALSNGGGLGLQAPTDYNRVVQEARSYPELVANMFVQDSMLLTLFKTGDKIAQNQLERDMYALCARDRQRIMDYQIERLKHFLYKMPDRREEQNLPEQGRKPDGEGLERLRRSGPLAILLAVARTRSSRARRS
jgi:hypothetical protein